MRRGLLELNLTAASETEAKEWLIAFSAARFGLFGVYSVTVARD